MVNPIAVGLVVVLLGWAYKAIKPPRPKICGSPGGPLVTSPRVRLSDGRHLAYRESGVPKEEARYKIIVVHGFGSSKDLNLLVSQELIEDLGIYFLYFDRAGYGESDPYPSRSVKSEAYDIQELADKLQIGARFYVIGISMGAYPIWSCLKYIPHRLSGASLVAPFVSYWWPSFPANLSREALKRLPRSDQWTFRVAHYAPWLLYWWMTQKWFPSLSLLTGNMAVFCPDDLECLKSLPQVPTDQEKITQQGEHESLHRDIIAGFGKWEFDPTDISNPFAEKDGSVHIWQGYEDRITPSTINRYISQKLPWIHYHEVSEGGHLFIWKNNQWEAVEVMEELGLYILTFDRAGYGESDPNPKRNVKSEAFDIQELADRLQLGLKFYLIGLSIGTHPVWACLKYMPNRLAGVTLVVPVINFWWPSFPAKLAKQEYEKQLKRDQWKLRIAHHAPALVHWWMTQNIFPFCSIMQRHPILANKRDVETIKQMSQVPMPHEDKIRQQGEYESLHRDLIVHFGRWEFDPMELENPFPQNEGCVYLWQGHEDKLVPYELQRYLAKKLPWIRYCEVSDSGHLMIHERGLCEAIFRQLLLGEEPSIK